MSALSIPIRVTPFSLPSLIDCMSPLLEYPNTVTTPESFLLTSTEVLTFSIPDVVVDRERSKVTIEMPFNPASSSAASIASDTFIRTYDEMRKFPHDFTFALFAERTDQQMLTVFPRMNDQHDRATPDIILRVADKVYVLEFATCRNSQSIAASFRTKRFTYEGPLKSRVSDMEEDVFCFYGIIVVSVDAVCTNIPLPAGLVNELCARYRCALSVLSSVELKGMKFGEDKLSSIKMAIKDQLSSLDFNIIDFPSGRKFTEDILKPKDTKEEVSTITAKYYEKSLLAAIDKRKTPLFKCDLEVEMGKTQDEPENILEKITDEDIIAEFIKRYSEINPRTDLKSVVKFPLIEPGNFQTLPLTTPEDNPYATLWNDVILSYTLDGHDFLENEDLEKIEKIALSDYDPKEDDHLKENRKFYHKIMINVDNPTMLEFQKVGVEAKQAIKNPELEMYRSEKRKGLSLETDVTDLLTFIKDFNCTKECPKPLILDIFEDLVRSGLAMYGEVPRHGLESLQWISKTSLFNWCCMVSDIGVELSISLKQHCRKREFVLKKLRNYNVWLLIKPTNTESHIFVSIMVHGKYQDLDSLGNTFKTLLKFKNYACTEFVSFDEGKITNLVKTSSFFITQVAQWSRYFEEDYSKMVLSPECWSMIKLCLLVHLDDKHQTEEVMTLMRYVCMERFSSVEAISNLKMLDKIPKTCRSRLQVWATQVLFSEMLQGKYILEDSKGNKDPVGRSAMGKWKGLRNPYLDIEVQSPQHLIELFYLGYAKNKDEKSNPNQDFKLINKIVKYEDKLNETNSSLFGTADIAINYGGKVEIPIKDSVISDYQEGGQREGKFVIRESPELFDIKVHEWSKSCVLHSSNVLAMMLEKMLGSSWKAILEENILSRLAIITWEEIATLKASSIFDPSDSFGREPGRIHTKREKVIIRVIQELESMGETPMSSLVLALHYLEGKGGLLVDIFKKNQHGGLREIYVLDLYSRLIQRALEEIAKAYCVYLPSEVMVHPENKIRRPQHHLMNVAKTGDKYKKNISSSNDASVWNQGHHVLKFTQFMSNLLPNWLLPFYQRGMQLWMTRKIKIPDGVMNLLMEKPNLRMWDEVENTIAKAYKGFVEKPWLKPSSNYLEIESGMMQGILHYTSSLFHASVLLCRDNLFQRVAKKRGFTAFTCDMVSSDDSSRITDVVSKLEQGLRIGEFYAMLDHICIKDFSKLFGIQLSPKSTVASNWVMEFNSEWLFRVNLVRPVLKWSFACLGMTEDESIYDRQEVWNVQLTELLEGGGGFLQCHLSQIAQSLLHYQILGMAVNPLFMMQARQLRDIPDPSLGFFIMDHPIATGLMGLSFSHWIVMTSSLEVNQRAALFLRQGEMTTTTKGVVTRGCVIRYGERKRAQKLIESSEKIYPNWRLDVEEDPAVLYMAPRDKRTSALKIMTKLTSPSVMTSLSKNSALTRIIASSVYIINRHAVTLGSAWLKAITQDEEYKEMKKTSLYKEAKRELPLGNPLSDSEMSLMFPAYREYQLLLEKINLCRGAKLVKGGSRKSLRSHIPILSGGNKLPYSLESMCRWRWFGESLPASKRILEICWNEYLKMVPWLRDSPQLTLEDSKAFETQIQLRNFIARQGPRTRLVHLTGAPVKDSSHTDMILSALTRNQGPGLMLVPESDFRGERVSSTTDSLAHNLEALHTYPCTDKYKTIHGFKIFTSHAQIWQENMKMMNNRQSRMALLQYYCQMDKSDPVKITELFSLINDSRLGVVGGFQKRQDRDGKGGWTGAGLWVGKVGDVPINLSFMDDYLTRVIVSSVDRLREVQSIFAKFIKESNVKVKNSRNFIDVYYFDGQTISPSNMGVPISESADLIEMHPMNQRLEFVYGMESFRLIARDRPSRKGASAGPAITLISYQPKSWDYQPAKDQMSDKRSVLYQAWSKNQSLSEKKALEILQENTQSVKYPLDESKFRDFVRISLLSNLLSRGWSFEIGGGFLDQITATALQDEAELMFGDDEDLFDDLDFDENEAEIVEQYADDQGEVSSDTSLAFDWQDVELGLMDLMQNPISQVDLRRGHLIWAKLARLWTETLSHRERNELCNKKYSQRTEYIARIFEYYFNWEMTLYDSRMGLLIDPAEEDLDNYTAEEDIAEDMETNIGDDDWWDISKRV